MDKYCQLIVNHSGALPDNDPLFVNWANNYLKTLEDSDALEELTWEWFENPDWMKRLP